jgi:ABC-type bacteriocin/lantibiotic exporter with double-glycine peptidase domain
MLPLTRTGNAKNTELLLMVLCAFICILAAPLINGFAFQRQRVWLDVPRIKQSYMRCLVASVSMVLGYWGGKISPDVIGEHVAVYKDGTAGRDLADFVESLGFHGFLIQPSFEDLLDHLGNGRPPIISLPEGNSSRHAMVCIGYDLSAGTISFNDPASGKSISQELASFRKRWEKGQRWTFLIVPK